MITAYGSAGKLECVSHLYWREVEHVVAGVVGHLQPALPMIERAKTLGQHRLTDDRVHTEHLIVSAPGQRRVHHEIPRATRVRVLAANESGPSISRRQDWARTLRCTNKRKLFETRPGPITLLGMFLTKTVAQ